MSLQLKLIHKLTYKLKLTPQIRLNINLLQMPLNKLKEYIQQQIDENPLLEPEKVGLSLNSKELPEALNYRENLITQPLGLTEYLLEQLYLYTNSDYERKIGKLLIGNIDDNGYLRSPVENIAKSAKARPTEVTKLLFLIQTFDPVGVGARDLKECLLLQLKSQGRNDSLVYQIVDKYLPYLEKKQYDYIAKNLSTKGKKVTPEMIKEATKEIARLEPKPGRHFNVERIEYLVPDALLRKNNNGYEVINNNWELPPLTLNDRYKRMILQKDTPEDVKEYLRERLKAAQLLIKAIKKRKETIQKIIGEIIHFQKGFFDVGTSNFKPMTLSQIANKIGTHKSTVSRAISNKYLQTPQGIFELRYFFNSGVKQKNGEYFSSKAIRAKIKTLIAKEDKKNPWSDQKIAELLNQEGISISRRTIAKYRNQLKILPFKSR